MHNLIAESLPRSRSFDILTPGDDCCDSLGASVLTLFTVMELILMIALLNLSLLGFSFVVYLFVFHYKGKRTQQGNLLGADLEGVDDEVDHPTNQSAEE